MKLRIDKILSGMLIKHPNYKEKVVVETVIKDLNGDSGVFGIYWRVIGMSQTGGLLQGIPKGEMVTIDDASLREAYKSAEELLNDVWEYGAGWNETQQKKTAAALIAEQIKTFTFSDLLTTVAASPKMQQRIEGLYARQTLLLESAEEEEEEEKGGLVL